MPYEQDEGSSFSGGTHPWKWKAGVVDEGKFKKRLIKVKGGTTPNYLQVKDRLVMLRDYCPEATVETECVYHDPASNYACFRAEITMPNGAVGVGHGSETKADFPDYYEKAETKALGRAINAVGIGIQYDLQDWDYEATNKDEFVGVDSPVEAAPTNIANMTREQLLILGNKEKTRIGVEALKNYADEQNMGIKLLSDADDDQLRSIITWAQTQPNKK